MLMLCYVTLMTSSFLLFFFLGLYIFFTNKKNRLYTLFFVKSLALVMFSLSGILLQISKTPERALYWYQYINFFTVLLPCIIFLYYLELSEMSRKIFTVPLYISAAILIIWLLITKNPLHSVFVKENGFWIVKEPFSWYYFWMLVYGGGYYTFGCSAISLSWGKRSHLKKVKKQSVLLAAAIVVSTLILLAGDAILVRFISLPFINGIAMSFYFLVIFYALVKYRFMHQDIRDYFDEILHNMNDLVLLMNNNGRIIKANNAACSAYSLSEQALLETDLGEIMDLSMFAEEYSKLLSVEKNVRFTKMVNLKSSSGLLMADTYFSRVIDKFGDAVGILIVARKIPGLDYFKNHYGITSRQMDIILLSMEGQTPVEIADRLNISKRTVDSHLTAIYTKLDICNRVELISIVNKETGNTNSSGSGNNINAANS